MKERGAVLLGAIPRAVRVGSSGGEAGGWSTMPRCAKFPTRRASWSVVAYRLRRLPLSSFSKTQSPGERSKFQKVQPLVERPFTALPASDGEL